MNDSDQHGPKGHYQPGTFEIEGPRPFASLRVIPLPRTVDPRPVAEARRMLARGRAVRAVEALSGVERVALATAPAVPELTDAEIDHWSRHLADEARQEGRHADPHGRNRVNFHE